MFVTIAGLSAQKNASCSGSFLKDNIQIMCHYCLWDAAALMNPMCVGNPLTRPKYMKVITCGNWPRRYRDGAVPTRCLFISLPDVPDAAEYVLSVKEMLNR